MDTPETLERARRLPLYMGPYERWVFSPDLGRPFAFPAISHGPAYAYAAFLEGGADPSRLGSVAPTGFRLPPLWNPGGGALDAIPFALDQGGAPLPDFGDPDAGAAIRLTLKQALDDTTEADPDAERAMRPRYRVNYPISTASWVADYDPGLAFAGWRSPATRPAAIVGIIDDGLPFAHDAFIGGDGRSRVSHCWLQSAPSRTEPAAIPFGREFTNSQIDMLRATYTDEATLYRMAGAVDAALPDLGLHLMHRATHGAHIAGLAAGNDAHVPAPEIGDDVQIILVQLPNTVAWDTSGFGKEMFMLAAIHYVFDRARGIAAQYPDGPEELPLFVNFSYGWSANRHDGGAAIERAMQQMLTRRLAIQPATSLNMPMGNNFEKRMHAQFTRQDLDAEGFSIGWWLSPDDLTSSYLEIWLPEGFDTRGSHVSVVPPEGCGFDAAASLELRPATLALEGGDPQSHVDLWMDGEIVGQLSVDKHYAERWRVLLALIPTSYTRGQSRLAPAGQWVVRMECPRLATDAAINIWLQRDDDPGLLDSGGRQSHLVALAAPAATDRHPFDPQSFCDPGLPLVRGFGTFNSISSAPAVTRVAGYVQSSLKPSRYSGAAGLQRRPDGIARWGVGPAFAAPADQGQTRPGLPSIGVLSGSGARLQGTSAASALATRWMALNLAAGRPMLDGLQPLPPVPEDRKICLLKREARLGQGLVSIAAG